MILLLTSAQVIIASSNGTAGTYLSPLHVRLDVETLLSGVPLCGEVTLNATDFFPNCWNELGQPPLLAAVLDGFLDAVRDFIHDYKDTIDVNLADKNGTTALHAAAKTGQVKNTFFVAYS